MLVNSIEIFRKKRKTKIENIVANIIKIFQKMKNKGQLSIGKIILKCRKIKIDVFGWARFFLEKYCDRFGSQIPVTTGGFELQISCI